MFNIIPFSNEELKLYLYREYFTTTKSNIYGNYHEIKVNNYNNIQQYPYLKVTFLASATNPVIIYENTNTSTNIQINGNFTVNDTLTLDSRTKIAKKNTLQLNLTPSLFPIINQKSYFKIKIDKTIAKLELTYKTCEDYPTYMQSREDFTLNIQDKKVEVPQQYYNSDDKRNVVVGQTYTFDYTVLLWDSFFLNINSIDTYKIEIDVENNDEYRNIKQILCGCVFDINTSTTANNFIQHKISGSGILLGNTSSLPDLLYATSAVQLIINNNTKNLIQEIPFCETINPKITPKYREKKVFKSDSIWRLESIDVSIDCSAYMTNFVLRDWIGDSMTVYVNYYNASDTIPLIINNIKIDSITPTGEKDGLIKLSFTLSGNL